MRRGGGGKDEQGRSCPATQEEVGWGWGGTPLETNVSPLPAAARCPQPQDAEAPRVGAPSAHSRHCPGPPPRPPPAASGLPSPELRTQAAAEMFCFVLRRCSQEPRKQDTSKSGGCQKLLEGLYLRLWRRGPGARARVGGLLSNSRAVHICFLGFCQFGEDQGGRQSVLAATRVGNETCFNYFSKGFAHADAPLTFPSKQSGRPLSDASWVNLAGISCPRADPRGPGFEGTVTHCTSLLFFQKPRKTNPRVGQTCESKAVGLRPRLLSLECHTRLSPGTRVDEAGAPGTDWGRQAIQGSERRLCGCPRLPFSGGWRQWFQDKCLLD